MYLTFLPVRMEARLSATVAGDVLTLNGEVLDFGPLPDGAILPRGAISSPWIGGDVRREAGLLHVPLLLPHGADAPHHTRFPQPILLTGDGPVALPPHSSAPVATKEAADVED